jgi:hypothetical protein
VPRNCFVVRRRLQVLLRAADLVREQRVVPLDRARERLRVWIDQQLRRIEAVALCRIVGAVDAIAVELSGPDIGEIAMPYLIRPLTQPDLLGLDPVVLTLEEAQLHTGGVLRKDGEVHSRTIPGRSEGVGLSRPDSHVSFSMPLRGIHTQSGR